MRRAIENVEVACGIPMMMQGYNLEDVARGIDEIMIRQPLGVVAAIMPSNFPGMIPFWFLPYAIATGNTLVLKPSERVPLTSKYVFELLAQTGLPPGVVNLVNGGRESVDALVDHPEGARDQLCRIDGGCAIGLCARRGEWQAGAVPGRREEPCHRAAGCGHEDGDADCQRQRLWLRGAALPGGFGCGDGWRSAEDFPRLHRRRCVEAEGRQRTG